MKADEIYMNTWLLANKRKRAGASDTWYLNFANSLLPSLHDSGLLGNDLQRHKTAAISLALYFQDAISQNGGWLHFTHLHNELYKCPLPFYATGNNYVSDEINLQDVSYILWSCLASPASQHPQDYTVFDPHDRMLQTLATQMYDRMDALFEQAPVAPHPSPAWVKGTESLQIPSRPLPKHDTGGMITDANSRQCLEYSGGYPLLYFADYDELRSFFITTLNWENHPSSLMPDLAAQKEFVIYANAKGMLLAPGVAAFFDDRRNPLYNRQRATADGYRLFCQPGLCPFDLLKFGMANGMLDEARFPFPDGHETLQRNRDFIARYYLEEYYEGD